MRTNAGKIAGVLLAFIFPDRAFSMGYCRIATVLICDRNSVLALLKATFQSIYPLTRSGDTRARWPHETRKLAVARGAVTGRVIGRKRSSYRPQIGTDPEQNLVSPDVRMALEEKVANPFPPLSANLTEALS